MTYINNSVITYEYIIGVIISILPMILISISSNTNNTPLIENYYISLIIAGLMAFIYIPFLLLFPFKFEEWLIKETDLV